MKTITFLPFALAVALSAAGADQAKADESLGQKASDTLKKAGEKTIDAGRTVANTTVLAADAAVDAVIPDKDARRISVTLTERDIDLPQRLEPGKTAFVVRNAGKTRQNFEIKGEGIEKRFLIDLSPKETKVLHVDLTPGRYSVFCPGKGETERETESLTVR